MASIQWTMWMLKTVALTISLVTTALARPTGSTTCEGNRPYDFIIIGAGASGLTVADRLTEDPKVSVLVIEHGQFDNHEPAVMVPGLLNLTESPYWFPLTSVPQQNLNNRTFAATAGAGVGGSTIINGLFFDRGGRSDYDAWAQLGNEGWSWSDLLPYFIKSETFTPPTSDYINEWSVSYDASVHGNNGPVQSSFPSYQYAGVANFLDAWKSLGVQVPSDPVAGSKAGVFLNPSSMDYTNQSRSYARSAHYDRVIETRNNYCVLSMHTVTRILVQNGRATGVEYVARSDNNTKLTAVAEREVILAAGGYNSPKILQHSGIGPAEVLTGLGLDVTLDLPGVGHNLQDHPTFYTAWNLTNLPSPAPGDIDYNQTIRSAAIDEYYSSRTGPLTVVHYGGNAVAFLPLSQLSTDAVSINSIAQSSDANLFYPPETKVQILQGYEAQKSILLEILPSNDDSVQETGFGGSNVVPVTVVRPFSRGTVLINSTDPLQQAMIDYKTFSAPVDMKLMIAAIRKNREMMNTPIMQQLGIGELSPGANVTSDEDLESAIKAQGLPGYQHGCCTCAMMPLELGGVVDSNLKVHGIEGLRITDGSIMPILPATHTSATIYAVAEKAADLIKADYSLR